MGFIQRFGTHYVKAAKFGGQLKVIKSRAITSTSSIKDFRTEMQKQVNEMTGNMQSKQREDSTSKTGSKSGSMSGGSVTGSEINFERFFEPILNKPSVL